MKKSQHYRTIVISDVHLGTKGSKAKEVVQFLKWYTSDLLILNGDIIDGWQLRKSGAWKRKHTRFFQRVLKVIGTFDTEVVYIRGNHDDFLDQILPLSIGNLHLVRDYIHQSPTGKKYYVVHGDVFDSVTTKLKWIAQLGDIGYTFLLYINRVYNDYRQRRGLPYYSLSQVVKAKVKKAVSYISDYESQLVSLAELKNCSGIICGHIHQPAIKEINGIEYLNSGDWVESLSALVEDYKGEWSLVYFTASKKENEPETDTEEAEEDEVFFYKQKHA